jgi:hypothetical protein
MPSLLHLIPGPHVPIPGTADIASCRPKPCPVETWESRVVTSKESSPSGVVSSPLPSSKIRVGVMPSGQAQRSCSGPALTTVLALKELGLVKEPWVQLSKELAGKGPELLG